MRARAVLTGEVRGHADPAARLLRCRAERRAHGQHDLPEGAVAVGVVGDLDHPQAATSAAEGGGAAVERRPASGPARAVGAGCVDLRLERHRVRRPIEAHEHGGALGRAAVARGELEPVVALWRDRSPGGRPARAARPRRGRAAPASSTAHDSPVGITRASAARQVRLNEARDVVAVGVAALPSPLAARRPKRLERHLAARARSRCRRRARRRSPSRAASRRRAERASRGGRGRRTRGPSSPAGRGRTRAAGGRDRGGRGSRAARSTRRRALALEAIASSPARASRSGRPLQVARSAGAAGRVGGEVAAGELGQRGIAVRARERRGAAPSQSRVSAKAWLPSSRSGPSTAMPRSAASIEQVRRRLALGADALGGDPLGRARRA